jgi:hypothetical protein
MNFGEDVSIYFELRQMDDEATSTASAKFKGLRFVSEVEAKSIRRGRGGHLRFIVDWGCKSNTSRNEEEKLLLLLKDTIRIMSTFACNYACCCANRIW